LIETIDNINTLLGDDFKETIKSNSHVRIAAAAFSIYAFEALSEELKDIDQFEFLFTQNIFKPSEHVGRMDKERRQYMIPPLQLSSDLAGSPFEIVLKNKLTQKAIARECADWVRKKGRFLINASGKRAQPIATVEAEGVATAYLGMEHFTAPSLGYQPSDALSNHVMRMEGPAAEGLVQTLESLMSTDDFEEVTQTLLDHIERIYAENAPELIYFLLIYNLFNEFLDDLTSEAMPNDKTGYQDSVVWNTLYPFQRDAAIGIINKLGRYSGCILADSVGLGKTFTALGVIKYFELRNKTVLVLCPKRLAENWKTYVKKYKTNILADDRFNYTVLNHTDLLRERGESHGEDLSLINWENFDLVVIDESHNFRNQSAADEGEAQTRYQALLDNVIRSGVKTKVLMLSATPVNNRFADLRNQLNLAYEGQLSGLSRDLDMGTNVEDIFNQAQKAFNAWSERPLESRTAAALLEALKMDFFKVLDSVTIARSRKHITTYYDTAELGPFPKRQPPETHRPPLTDRPDVMGFNAIYAELSQLDLAVYTPLKYVFDSRLQKYAEMYDTQLDNERGFAQVQREDSLKGLMRVNLLKRLESSVEAFRLTLRKLAKTYHITLSAIDDFIEGGSGMLSGADGIDGDEDEANMIGGKVKVDLADMKVDEYQQVLEADLILINGLIAEMDKVTPDRDTKLQHLLARIDKKFETPLNAGNRKVLIFSAFADTANYLFDNVAPHLKTKQASAAVVTGGSGHPRNSTGKVRDFQSVLTLFSPISKSKDKTPLKDVPDIDVLIGTDCISEGQNLQDCDIVINYDIHWNPTRIIQRFGRVDRIGSPNAKIQLVNYWPDIDLDEYINLKERVESRMVAADMTATGDDNLLAVNDPDAQYRKSQLEALMSEDLEPDDAGKGVSIADLGLNEFRMDLARFIEARDYPKNLPTGLHSVVPANPAVGLKPGVIFALRNIKADETLKRGNRLHPYYLVYIGADGRPIVPHSEPKRVLDLLRMAAKGQATPISAVVTPFNKETRDGRDMSAYSDLLSKAIDSLIEREEGRALDSVFSPGQADLLQDGFGGLDDFDLLCFFVVREA